MFVQLDKYETAPYFFYQTNTIYILDITSFANFCVFPHFSLNLPELNLKIFWTAEENNFRFSSGKFREKRGKTQKSTNNLMSSFGLIEKIWSCLIFIKLYLKKLIFFYNKHRQTSNHRRVIRGFNKMQKDDIKHVLLLYSCKFLRETG